MRHVSSDEHREGTAEAGAARRPRAWRPLSTRDLLVCAVLGVLTAGMMAALAVPLAATAAASPPLYALLGGYSAIAPLLALRLVRGTGAATIVAAVCSIIAWPFSPLGLLVAVAQLVPAVVIDLLYAAARRLGPAASSWVATAGGAVAVFVLSLAVFSPDHLTPALLALTLVQLRLSRRSVSGPAGRGDA